MDTQNTPVHLKLWHREFWMLALANLMLMMSAYGLLPTLPFYLLGRGLDDMQTGLVMGIYGAGLFALGGFCSYYVQRYRRNHVCQYSILGLVLCMGMAYYLEFVLGVEMEFRLLLLVRFAIGAFLGLAAMVLGSTLAIDICESVSAHGSQSHHSMVWPTGFGHGTFSSTLSLRLLGLLLHPRIFGCAGTCSLCADSDGAFPLQGPIREDATVQS